jgi:hypothetical protein
MFRRNVSPSCLGWKGKKQQARELWLYVYLVYPRSVIRLMYSILPRVCSVAIDEVWTGNLIHHALIHRARNYKYSAVANLYTLEFASTHTLVFSACSVFICFLVTAYNGGRSPSCEVPNCPRPQLRASNSNKWQELNCSSARTLSLTHQLTIDLTPTNLSCL